MKKGLSLLSILVIAISVIQCSGHHEYGKGRYHKEKLGDPSTYNAHFPDMDAGGDDLVNWEEFKAYFPDTTPGVFKALDLNKDDSVDHDEWHAFKEAHGLKDRH